MARILVVEDSDPARHSMVRALKRKGYDVIEASNGQNGIRMLEKASPDVVVTDIVMPEMEGLEFIKWIKKNKLQVPVIVVTGHIDTSYMQAAFHFGADIGLEKPFKEHELLSAIDKVLSKDS